MKNGANETGDGGLSCMNKPGVYIISYWIGKPWLSTMHTVTVKYDGKQYKSYNYMDNTYSETWQNYYAANFVAGYYLGE